jgi:hypothetical protein
MRTLASLALLCLMATTAQATPLKLVHVSAKAVYRTFDTDGRIAVRDFTDDFVLPGTIGKGILLSRRFPRGQPGTTGAGRYAYLYRLDLRELVEDTARPCVDVLRLDFGPVVPLDYTGDGTPDEVFVMQWRLLPMRSSLPSGERMGSRAVCPVQRLVGSERVRCGL